jgi:hypothetical protein
MRSLWKSCVEAVVKASDACGQSMEVLHNQVLATNYVWKTPRSSGGLYTFCMRYCTATVGNFTSVNYRLYTVYTGLTNTTTN